MGTGGSGNVVRWLAAVGFAALLVVGIVGTVSYVDEESGRRSRQETASPQPSRSERKGLCQPFPDRLIDDLIASYNGRDEDGLEALVTDRWIDDAVASAYDGSATFRGVGAWAQAGWDAGDVIDLAGYGAFHPTTRGFQMFVTRRSETLRREGIDAVSVTLDAVSRGCSIASLAMSGSVQARREPCRFYDAFGHVPEVGGNEPPECHDGSDDHARQDHVMVWTGRRALIWGGRRGGWFEYPDVVMDGLAFDPRAQRWTAIPAPNFRHFLPEIGVWTGRELLVLGNSAGRKNRTIAAAYNPQLTAWRWVSFPYPKWSGFEGMWTGSHLLLWGGPSHTRALRLRGALLDPETDTWRRTAPAPIAGRDSHVALWTGTEMIVWGGSNWRSDLDDGAAYDPATDTWRTIAPAPLSARQWLPAVWTGTEMIVWGGSSYSRPRADGAAYDPATDSWRKLPPAPIAPRHYHSATWTGTEMIVFGGYDYEDLFDDGAAYDPVTDRWRKVPSAPIAPRFGHTALWDGRRLFVFGGNQGFGHMALGDGALYDPDRRVWTLRVYIPST